MLHSVTEKTMKLMWNLLAIPMDFLCNLWMPKIYVASSRFLAPHHTHPEMLLILAKNHVLTHSQQRIIFNCKCRLRRKLIHLWFWHDFKALILSNVFWGGRAVTKQFGLRANTINHQTNSSHHWFSMMASSYRTNQFFQLIYFEHFNGMLFSVVFFCWGKCVFIEFDFILTLQQQQQQQRKRKK